MDQLEEHHESMLISCLRTGLGSVVPRRTPRQAAVVDRILAVVNKNYPPYDIETLMVLLISEYQSHSELHENVRRGKKKKTLKRFFLILHGRMAVYH